MLPWLRIRDNVMLPLKIVPPFRQEYRAKRFTEFSDRADALLAQVGLKGFGDKHPWQLSGGMLQRASLCRALVHDPQLLLLDEPFGALDARVRTELRAWLRRLHEETHTTTVFVTHDQEEALSMSDRIAVMRSGNLEQIADPRSIYEKPATPFVAKFVGATNLLSGIVAQRDGNTATINVDGTAMFVLTQIGRVGEGVELSLRPEALRLLSAGEAPPAGWAVVNGVLEDIEYLGAATRLSVRLSGGALLQLMAATSPLPSSSMTVAYDPRCAVVWRHDV